MQEDSGFGLLDYMRSDEEPVKKNGYRNGVCYSLNFLGFV